MTFDPKSYLSHLDEFDASEAEKIAVIEAMWIIAQGFADHAFGLTAGQQLWTDSACKNGANDNEMIDLKPVGSAFERAANDNEPAQDPKGIACK